MISGMLAAYVNYACLNFERHYVLSVTAFTAWKSFYKAPNQGIYPQINSKLQFFNYKTVENLLIN